MSQNLQPYQRALDRAEADLRAKLGNGRATARDVAIARRTAEIMAATLRESPGSVLAHERFVVPQYRTLSPPERWYYHTQDTATQELFPHEINEIAQRTYLSKLSEYHQFAWELISSVDMRQRWTVDRQTGRGYLYQENQLVPRIMQVIGGELYRWFSEYPVDREFYKRQYYLTWPARTGYALFLEERPDICALLRIAQTLPFEPEISQVRVDRPVVVEAVELAIGLAPVLSSIVAAYEAYAGIDLFGYHLTDLERGILAASVLLPIAGRVVKGGRAIYSEARMVALYGRDAATWSRILRAGGQATASSRSLRVIEEAEAAIRAQGNLDRTLAQRAATELPNIVRGSAPFSSTVDQVITDLFRQISSSHSILRSLDEQALQRVLEKGPNVDHLKGQLLEEMIEARVVPWLRDRAGSSALGVQTASKQLEFIPGNLIRDRDGLQVTDGILAFRDKGVLNIAAVFESKAGARGVRELSLGSGGISSLSTEGRASLRAFAKDAWRDLREEAQAAGRPFNTTLAEVELAWAQARREGQISRDVETLVELGEIRVGADWVHVRMSPTRTKFFGVVPKDVSRTTIDRVVREVSSVGYNIEFIGADITQRDLSSIAEQLVPLATTMTGVP